MANVSCSGANRNRKPANTEAKPKSQVPRVDSFTHEAWGAKPAEPATGMSQAKHEVKTVPTPVSATARVEPSPTLAAAQGRMGGTKASWETPTASSPAAEVMPQKAPIKQVAFQKPPSMSSYASVVANGSNSSVSVTSGPHVSKAVAQWSNPIIFTGAHHTNSPNEQYADAFGRYKKSKQKPSKVPREKKPGGWLTKEERKKMAATTAALDEAEGAVISYNENGWGKQPEIDWNAANQLLDWEGNPLPPPVEWDSRRQCSRDNWHEFIFDFVFHSQDHYVEKKPGKCGSTLKINMNQSAFKSDAAGELAPRDWILTEADNQPLQTFWNSLHQHEPRLVDEEDVLGTPFWQRYEHGCDILKPLHHEDARCEPVDDQDPTKADELALWQQSQKQTASSIISTRTAKHDDEETEKRLQRHIEKELKKKEKKAPKIAPPPNKHRPKANVFLKPMNIAKDLASVYSIYAHYAKDTVFVSDLEPVSMHDFRQRLNWVQSGALPMIVAVESIGKKSRHGNSAQEKIVGFAVADEDEGRATQQSHIACLEVYVHHDYLGKGIGKNIVDRMLYLLDPMYHVVSDVVWDAHPDDLDYNTPGGRRVIGTVRAVLYYDNDDRTRCSWINEWLKQYGFDKQADFTKAGMKLGKWWVRLHSTTMLRLTR